MIHECFNFSILWYLSSVVLPSDPITGPWHYHSTLCKDFRNRKQIKWVKTTHGHSLVKMRLLWVLFWPTGGARGQCLLLVSLFLCQTTNDWEMISLWFSTPFWSLCLQHTWISWFWSDLGQERAKIKLVKLKAFS